MNGILVTYADDPAWLDRYGLEAELFYRPHRFKMPDGNGANFLHIEYHVYEIDFCWIVADC